MASEIILRDENHVTVGAAISNDTDQDVIMLRVDPVTNYLLTDVSPAGVTSYTESQIARRDENYRPVCLAWNEQDNELQEVLTDENGRILCDILFM